MAAMQKRLFQFLREHHRDRCSFTVDDAIDFTGYQAQTLRTYLSKQLKDVWVSAVDARHYRVHDFDDVTYTAFADAMSQNTRLSFTSEQEWRAQVRHLLALGVQHGYPVADAVHGIVRELGAA
jgi:hypothetical protein